MRTFWTGTQYSRDPSFTRISSSNSSSTGRECRTDFAHALRKALLLPGINRGLPR